MITRVLRGTTMRLVRGFAQKQAPSESQMLDLELTQQNRAELLFNTKLPEGRLVLLGQAQNYALLHLYGMAGVAGSYLLWGLTFGVLSLTEILLSLGGVVGVAALTARQRRFNATDKVFAIVKTPEGYSVGVLRGRGLKPEYVAAGKADIKISEPWTKPQLGLKITVKGQPMTIPSEFKVDHRLWKELL